MEIFDISAPLVEKGMVYPGDTPFHSEVVSSIKNGDECTLSKLTMSSHSGTHFDAPSHFIPDGLTVENVSLKPFYGPVRVTEYLNKDLITSEEIEPYLEKGVERLLCRTRGSQLIRGGDFKKDHPALTSSAARLIADFGLKLVGIDYITIERAGGDFPVHKILLGNKIAILEGLQLENIEPGDYILSAFPLKIHRGDGAPCRAVLIKPS